MTEKNNMESGGISRRDFLKDAGLLAGGAIIGSPVLLTACNGEGNSTDVSTKPNLITVLNPKGQPPPIVLVPMAPRLDTLDGKTIYVVDINYTGTRQFQEELAGVLSEQYPSANVILKVKSGSYSENDPALWSEIGEKVDAVVMGLGH